MFFKKKDKKVFTLTEKMEQVYQHNVKAVKDKLDEGFVEFEISFTNSVYNYSDAILNLPENSSFDEEEEANYYTTFGADGETLEKNYYLSIDLTNYIKNIKGNLSNLSYVYSIGQQTHTLTIGSELDILFYKKDNIVKPVLILKSAGTGT